MSRSTVRLNSKGSPRDSELGSKLGLVSVRGWARESSRLSSDSARFGNWLDAYSAGARLGTRLVSDEPRVLKLNALLAWLRLGNRLSSDRVPCWLEARLSSLIDLA